MFDTVEETIFTNYITRLDVIEIDSIPDDVFVILETEETIDGFPVKAKLLRNEADHFLLIEKENYPKFVIRKEQCLLDLLLSIEPLNIGMSDL